MAQYAKSLPVDQNNNPYTVSTPNFVSNQSWQGVPITSSVIQLTDRTTVIQLASQGGSINFKWGTSSVTASNFDGTIVSGNTQTFVVPQSVMAANSVMGANGANGLYNSISVKVATGLSGSVFGAEF